MMWSKVFEAAPEKTITVVPPGIFDDYENSLERSSRYTDVILSNQGITNLIFRDKIIVRGKRRS
jgi:hypothetical protein